MKSGHHPATRIAALAACATLAAGGALGAGESEWSVEFEPVFMDAYGHDQHVLTIQESGPGEVGADSTAVALDTDSGLAYRLEVQKAGGGKWSWGLDFLWFVTSQQAAEDASPSGGGEVVFQMADHRFASADPGDTLFYSSLEDTSLAMWTLDLLAMRTLTEATDGGLDLLLGLRSADFDNDYRAVVGVFDVEGVRFDASSNYGRMTGPLVGLAGWTQLGRHRLDGSLRQSVVLGTAELSNMAAAFRGEFEPYLGGVEELPEGYAPDSTFRTEQDVAIPISELRFKWSYGVTRSLALGLGVESSVWWDVPVPPGVIPGQGQSLHENTVVLFGLAVSAKYTF